MSIDPEPDTKNWTWVLERRCPECAYDAASTPAVTVAARLRDEVVPWRTALAGPDEEVRRRPAAAVWSVLEYACHVRDVCRVSDTRVQLMRAEDFPAFPNWDQDETAVADRYADQEPEVVSAELADAAGTLADRLDDLAPAEWARTGRRSDGSVFTLDSLSRYVLHDVVHHRWDRDSRTPVAGDGAPSPAATDVLDSVRVRSYRRATN